MEFDYTPYPFEPALKIPSEIAHRLRPFCEYKTLRDEVNQNLYLETLCSLSLSLLEKHQVLKNIQTLEPLNICQLSEVFQDEIQRFSDLYGKEKEDILTLILRMLLNTMILLRIYQVFDPTEEKVIFKKIFSEWLKDKNDEEQLVYNIIQRDRYLLKYLYKYCHS